MHMELTGKVALVTGTRRIGSAVAVELGRRGMHVALAYSRSALQAEDAAETIRRGGGCAAVLQVDLRSPDACQGLITSAVEALGRLNVLINAASVYEQRAFDDLQVGDWDGVLEVDLRAAFLCARAAVPYMRAQGGGRIVNFSDWIARSGRPRYRGFLPYYVAKAGVIALTEALALELASDNILVNAVAPGPILAPPGTSATAFRSVEEATPLGRWGGEQEIVKTVLALLDSDFITGETIRVDGGRHVR